MRDEKKKMTSWTALPFYRLRPRSNPKPNSFSIQSTPPSTSLCSSSAIVQFELHLVVKLRDPVLFEVCIIKLLVCRDLRWTRIWATIYQVTRLMKWGFSVTIGNSYPTLELDSPCFELSPYYFEFDCSLLEIVIDVLPFWTWNPICHQPPNWNSWSYYCCFFCCCSCNKCITLMFFSNAIKSNKILDVFTPLSLFCS